jgi:DNA-binding MarR family transcriptional regulator
MIALNRPEPVSMGPVAALLGMGATTYSPEDKRSPLLRLTSQGDSTLAKAVPIWEESHAELDRSLAGYDVDQFRPVLRVFG